MYVINHSMSITTHTHMLRLMSPHQLTDLRMVSPIGNSPYAKYT